MTLGHVSNLILCLSYMISTLRGPDIKFNKKISGCRSAELIGFHSPFSPSVPFHLASLSVCLRAQLNTLRSRLLWRSR